MTNIRACRCTRLSCSRHARCTFGHSSRIHTTKILRLAQDLPIVIELVDTQDKVDAFLPVLDEMMSNGLVTLEKVQVLQYGKPPRTASS